MKAKEYLRQIKRLDDAIMAKIDLLNTMNEMLTATGGTDFGSERVVSSAGEGMMTDRIIDKVDLEMEIRKDVEKYIRKKNRIINQVNGMIDTRFQEILTLRYIAMKTEDGIRKNYTLAEVADIMGYSYDHARRLHGEALMAFTRLYLNEPGRNEE